MFVLITKIKQGSVRLLIAKKGMSHRDFAKSIGISHSYLSQLVNGKRKPSPSTAGKIALGLNVDLSEIFLYKVVTKDNHREVKERSVEVR
ncbi:helix-turn-helix domain-containing protein [Jeotgalibacillus proteolyticus]|uniref:XRE family transcriptional regulator n=1 Tax=Jeotgalibacillus proteolyticus TaxID=2082395 RepID=A0A2S5GBA9_9BACL|nr:helix-turn-helix transcriptional regulator [Jeotgalibacillus proteolyticus]PPA70183.1 XRE family transcriptional regulator [Jeotgalibacillus proteolyticus]